MKNIISSGAKTLCTCLLHRTGFVTEDDRDFMLVNGNLNQNYIFQKLNIGA